MLLGFFLLLSLQVPCDADCLDLWFRSQFDGLPLLPPEVAAETLLNEAAAERDGQKQSKILAKVDELLSAVMEEFPVAPLVLNADSVPGEAMRASAERFNRVSLRMRLIELKAKVDLPAAIEEWHEQGVPLPTNKHLERGEVAGYLIYYRIAMQLYDQLIAEGRSAEANLHLLRVLNTIRTQHALADFHQVLTLRMQKAKLTSGFLALYRARLAAILPLDQPQQGNWVRIAFFWKLLLEGEAQQSQPELLDAVDAYLRHSSEAPPLGLQFAVKTTAGTRYWGNYWPDEARVQFEKILAPVNWADGMAERAGSLSKLFVGGTSKIEDRPMTAFWARPHSAALFEQYVELRKGHKTLSAQGAWEPRLGLLLEELKTYGAKDPSPEDHLLDFLEKARIYQGLLGLSGVDGTIAVKPENALALEKQLKERPPHLAKRSIILALIDLLESEAGIKVYRQRRLLWLGVLRRLRDEVYQVKGEVLEDFKERAMASSNEIIRHYAE